MKTSIKIFSAAWVLLLAFTGCEEDKLPVFDGVDNIYFQQSKWPHYGLFSATMTYNGKEMTVTGGVSPYAWTNSVVDSMTVSMSFRNPELVSDTTFLPVAVAGRLSDKDRKIAWSIVDSGDAVEGVDFKVLDAFIPANSREGGIVVELFRKNAAGKYLHVKFRLEDNGIFGVNYPLIALSSTDDTPTSTIDMKIKWTDGLQPPTPWWNYDHVSTNTMLYGEFGSFSVRKLFVFTDILGVPWETIYNPDGTGNMLFARTGSVYGQLLYKWLVRYEMQNGSPYLDEDGTPMRAGAKYY